MPVVADPKDRRPLDHACSKHAVRIVRGMPGPELIEAAERREVVLGGCDPDGPTHQCRLCGRTWGGIDFGRF